MAAENEQKFLECIGRVEKEVGIDEKELKRRINKALKKQVMPKTKRKRRKSPQRKHICVASTSGKYFHQY